MGVACTSHERFRKGPQYFGWKILLEQITWDTIKVHIVEMVLMVWIGFMWLRIGTSESSCEHDNELFRSIKAVEFLD
jgi:hypothetical protein